MKSTNQAGKGDKPRPTNKEKYTLNFEEIQGWGKTTGKLVSNTKGKITYKY